MLQDLKKHSPLMLAITAGLVLGSASYLGAKDPAKKAIAKNGVAQMEDGKRAVHVLNRLTFGPRPGDLEKVNAMGVEKWIDLQLNPEKIDDSALQTRLEPFKTLKMDTSTIVAHYPPPPVLQAIAAGRIPMPSDPKTKAVYESQLAIYKARRAAREKAEANGEAVDNPQQAMMADDQDGERNSRRREARAKAAPQISALRSMSPRDRTDAIMKMPADERLTLVQAMAPQEREQLIAGMNYEQREMLQSLANPQGVITNELIQAKLLRAVYSERQLEEVMVDFWFNHFNVFINKGADRYLTTAYERDAIRKHALGKFEEMLVATAKDPAMLFYLDNFQSVGPNSMAGKRSGQPNLQGRPQMQRMQRQAPQTMTLEDDAPPPSPKRGLNENYARELMELHTLGVDGGYTQKDIVEVAKVFTGWTARQPRLGGDFEFNDRIHEPGPKVILGKKFDEGGESEGRKVLHMLATHPSTAKFISKKLAMRFVADNPPTALVDRMSSTFLSSNGDIKQVLRTMLKSPEFWAPDAYRAKVKTPLEFVVSAVRVTGSDVLNAQPLAQTLQRMGMPLYGAQPPTGYSMKAESWVNSAALLNRMNFALALSSGFMRGLNVNKDRVLGSSEVPKDPDAALEVLSNALLAGDLSRQTQATIRKQLADPQFQQQPAQQSGEMLRIAERSPGQRLGTVAGLILGSPEFQRR